MQLDWFVLVWWSSWVYSFILTWEANEDSPSNDIATRVNSEKSPQTAWESWILWDLSVWITGSCAPALPITCFNIDCSSLVVSHLLLKDIEVVVHESLVSIFEDGKILKFFKVYWNVIWADKESCKEHEWDDEDWSQCNCELLVWEWCWDNQRVSWTCIVDQNQTQ